MDYVVTFEDGSREHLAHHGIKGMKWGVWNAETKQRYGDIHSESHNKQFLSGEKMSRKLDRIDTKTMRRHEEAESAKKRYNETKTYNDAKKMNKAIRKEKKADIRYQEERERLNPGKSDLSNIDRKTYVSKLLGKAGLESTIGAGTSVGSVVVASALTVPSTSVLPATMAIGGLAVGSVLVGKAATNAIRAAKISKHTRKEVEIFNGKR